MDGDPYLALAVPASMAQALNVTASRVLPGTRKRYETARQHWLRYCRVIFIHPFEGVTIQRLCLFVHWLSDQDSIKSAGTLTTYISGLKDWFLLHWKPQTLDLFSSYIFKMHVKACVKKLRPPDKAQDPFEHLFCTSSKGRITSAILKEIIKFMPTSTITQRNIIDTIISVQSRLLRLGEACATKHNGGKVPSAKNFRKVDEDTTSIFLQFSKTDVRRLGTYVYAHRGAPGLDPVAADLNIFWRSHANNYNPNRPFYCDEHGQPIQAIHVIRTLRAALKQAGFNTNNYAGHSLRRGGAQDLFDAGVDPALIMQVGRWTSTCWATYVRMPPHQRKAILSARYARRSAAG